MTIHALARSLLCMVVHVDSKPCRTLHLQGLDKLMRNAQLRILAKGTTWPWFELEPLHAASVPCSTWVWCLLGGNGPTLLLYTQSAVN